MLLIDNPIQPYAWGRRNGIADTLGAAPSGGPEAELWVGTHPRGRSVVAEGPSAGDTLAEVIAADPLRWLGAGLASSGRTDLPFLLKVLAIGSPLSLQAHPSAAQAAAGFAREEAAGVALDAPERVYRDGCPKPEALVALAPTTALCGFRPVPAARALVAEIDDAATAPLLEALDGDPVTALHDALAWILRLRGTDRRRFVDVVLAAARRAASADPTSAWHWVDQLGRRHPDDPGCAAPLLLEVLHLAPGDAVHLPAGNLHAYLHGLGVEIMSASDNVLRGALTPKHVDVDELLAIVTFEPGVPAAPPIRIHGAVTVYNLDETTFGLARLDPAGGPVAVEVVAPTLLLPMGAGVRVAAGPEHLHPRPTQAVYVAPGTTVVIDGPAPVWWATTGDGLPGR